MNAKGENWPRKVLGGRNVWKVIKYIGTRAEKGQLPLKLKIPEFDHFVKEFLHVTFLISIEW